MGNSRAVPEDSGFPSLYLVFFPGPGADVTTAYAELLASGFSGTTVREIVTSG